MADLSTVSNEDLLRELTRRGLLPRCDCGKWDVYVDSYHDVRCHGCRAKATRCVCR